MSGEGTSMGHSQPRTCSGNKTLRRCKNKEKEDNVVLIDVDVDVDVDVIIIDVPEYTPKKFRGRSSGARREKSCTLRNVICIDDDENVDENNDDEAADEFVRENLSPVTLSKCKRTYSGKGLVRNRYGLSAESEGGSSDDDDDDEPDCEFMDVENVRQQWEKASLKRKNGVNDKSGLNNESEGGSSDNDEPDCEFVEDPHKNIREQWEMASLKRKNGVLNGKSGIGVQASASSFCTDAHLDIGVENETEQHRKSSIPSTSNKDSEIQADAPVSSSSSKGSYEKEDHSPSMETSNGILRSSFVNTKNTPFTDTDLKSMHETQFQHSEADFWAREEFFTDDIFRYYAGWNADFSFQNEEGCSPQVPPLSPQDEQEILFEAKENTPLGEPSLSDSDPVGDINSFNSKASLPNEEASLKNGQLSVETNEKDGAVPEEFSFCNNSSLGKSEIVFERGCHQEKRVAVSEICNIDINESHLKQGSSCLVEEDKEVPIESVSNGQHEDGNDKLLLAEDGDDTASVQCSLINGRENLKETDEYKRAVEEEWASRQRELQIQAEEAQQLKRLRKRRKAESMRLLDMERRQKQRVEEIRETQKKDEENMNLKELLRAEVRKELSKLELTCLDMASLLRGLGVHVNGGLQPLPNEVRTAYKRALLNFHPDRASQSDLRQQVEAEEKFKLISRMKEKFLLTL